MKINLDFKVLRAVVVVVMVERGEGWGDALHVRAQVYLFFALSQVERARAPVLPGKIFRRDALEQRVRDFFLVGVDDADFSLGTLVQHGADDTPRYAPGRKGHEGRKGRDGSFQLCITYRIPLRPCQLRTHHWRNEICHRSAMV